MAGSADREVNTGESFSGQGQERREDGGRALPGLTAERLQVTRVSDEDYRSVWRPCHALEEDDGETAG